MICGPFATFGNFLARAVLRGRFAVVFLFLMFALSVFFLPIKSAYAHPCVTCSCINFNYNLTRNHIRAEHNLTRTHIAREFEFHRQEFIRLFFFEGHILPAMMMMTEQITATAMAQMFAVGAFFDAKNTLETQRLMQELSAKAHKDYHPSVQMCTFGTIGTSIGASKKRGDFNHFGLSQQIMDRQSLHHAVASAGGRGQDIMTRFAQFREHFCDPRDNNGQLGAAPVNVCPALDNQNVNRDIDYTRTIEYPLTLEVNFDNTNIQDDEEKVIALASYLYGHNVPEYNAEELLESDEQNFQIMRLRGILAKRSVAQNSYSAIVGLKSEGTTGTFQLRSRYLRRLMEQMGITNVSDINSLLYVRPSYYAQMELLTKSIYQTPSFYTNLYDKPANVDRIRASMRAIGLMQKMDTFDSRLRSEAALAVLAETVLEKEQRRIQNNLIGRYVAGRD